MPKIAILSASVRTGRKSHRTALFLQRFIQDRQFGDVDLIDLSSYDFPVFHERLKNLDPKPPAALEFAQRITGADGVIIVTPEYNGGYPAALKNVVDLLYDEWHRKPVAICTNSDGSFGGMQVITSLQFSLWKIRAWTVPALFPIPKVGTAFDENGVPAEPEAMEKRATGFVKELLWCIRAKALMEAHD
ncbi:MAG: NAD(P)H-dependent oxidoreductase [Flavobacteriales bacterium]|nr:NAD(P)H-dependent oxidoreductase [Flavobacteriales bacterium]